MPGRIDKHETVGHIAVLADEVDERGQVRRKQQYKPTQLNFRWDERVRSKRYHRGKAEGSDWARTRLLQIDPHVIALHRDLDGLRDIRPFHHGSPRLDIHRIGP